MGLMFLSRKRSQRTKISLSHVNPTTVAPGNLIPLSFVRIYNGDEVDFNPSCFVQAFPMRAPLVNGFKICYEYFFIPDRLYNIDFLLDRRGITEQPFEASYPFFMAPTQYGQKTVTFAGDTWESFAKDIVQPNSLADYCDFPVGYFPVGLTEERAKFNALKAIGYLDVVNTYYVNQNVDRIPTAYWDYTPSTPNVQQNISYEHSALDNIIEWVKTGRGVNIAQTDPTSMMSLGTWEWLCSRASIFQRSFPDYYLEAWLKTSGYNNANVVIDLDASGNSISMRNISSKSHIQRWMDLAFAGGSRFSDFQESQFDTTSVKHNTSPLFLGSDRQFLGSNVIYQTTGYQNAQSPLGSFAGQSAGGQKFRHRRYSFGEPGYFMVMASLVPDVIYSRGMNPLNRELTLGHTYAPALDNIAMQPLMVEELDAQGSVSFKFTESTTGSSSLSATFSQTDADIKNTALGYVPAWSHIMQQVSRAHGRLASSRLGYWLLQRRYGMPSGTVDEGRKFLEYISQEAATSGHTYSQNRYEALSAFIESATSVKDFSPYIRSNAYNSVFEDIDNGAQNFVITGTFDMRVSRKKAKVNVPNTL